MPTIGLWVNDEVWNAWRLLNKLDGKGTKELKNALYRILEKHKEEIERMRAVERGEADGMLTVVDLLAKVTNDEIVDELKV